MLDRSSLLRVNQQVDFAGFEAALFFQLCAVWDEGRSTPSILLKLNPAYFSG
ncbi:hypothetical protein H6F67_26280 [Microcoleus sp. FACHB-1515]|uniref:hypothetical protein n=1 Tax=Cyanophyceae TaxID=3028117 RepID=UPI001688D97F|nr:hypothetical protein [Microcoleus sp. FACHB-1515]MBD2093357.1 hypothetical protein [Microcoleus sp. FACHB-1515]